MSLQTATTADVLRRYRPDPANLIMILQELQAAHGHITTEVVDAVSQYLRVPRSQIYSAASFYKAFSLQPRGKHQVDVCLGTACHVRGAGRLVTQFSEELDIAPGETTPDREVSLDTVHCVGACALGPVVIMDGEYHGEMTPRKLSKALKKCRAGEGGRGAPGAAADAAATAPTAAELGLVRISSPGALQELREELQQAKVTATRVISICAGSGCRALGSARLIETFQNIIEHRGILDCLQLEPGGVDLR